MLRPKTKLTKCLFSASTRCPPDRDPASLWSLTSLKRPMPVKEKRNPFLMFKSQTTSMSFKKKIKDFNNNLWLFEASFNHLSTPSTPRAPRCLPLQSSAQSLHQDRQNPSLRSLSCLAGASARLKGAHWAKNVLAEKMQAVSLENIM